MNRDVERGKLSLKLWFAYLVNHDVTPEEELPIGKRIDEAPDALIAKVSIAYLRARAVIEILASLMVALILASMSITLGILAVFVGLCGIWFLFHVRRMDRYVVSRNELLTKKLFSDQVDLSTTISRVQSVSVHQGILEIRYGVGTVIITTAATDPRQSEILWRHISNPDFVADAIRRLVRSQETA